MGIRFSCTAMRGLRTWSVAGKPAIHWAPSPPTSASRLRSAKRSSVSRSGSAAPPEFFTDRSLGRYVVPNALRALGLTVHTMAEVYGERQGQDADDEDW